MTHLLATLLVPLLGATGKKQVTINERSWLDDTSKIDTADQIVRQQETIIKEENIILDKNITQNEGKKHEDRRFFEEKPIIIIEKPIVTQERTEPIILYDKGKGKVIDLPATSKPKVIIIAPTQIQTVQTAIKAGVTSSGIGVPSKLSIETKEIKVQSKEEIITPKRRFNISGLF